METIHLAQITPILSYLARSIRHNGEITGVGRRLYKVSLMYTLSSFVSITNRYTFVQNTPYLFDLSRSIAANCSRKNPIGT